MKLDDFKNALRKGTVDFAYRKKDGTLRIAKGTLNLELVPKEKHPVGNSNVSDSTARYFDIEKDGWRSAITENIVWSLPTGDIIKPTEDEAAVIDEYVNKNNL